MLIERMLQKEGYIVVKAENGKQAFEKFKETPFEVILSDFNMPEMRGDEFIDALHQSGFNPVFMMATANSDISTVVEMMKRGVFDYILKPFNHNEIIAKVKKAFETADLRRMKNIVDKEHEIRIQKQISWNAWKETVNSRDRDKFDKALFYNLRTALSQGAGFGGLVTLINLISEQVQSENGNYYIDKEIMSLIKINAAIAKQVLDTFNEIDLILNKEIKTEKLNVQTVYDIIKDLATELIPKLNYKKQKIQISEPTGNFKNSYILGERHYLYRVFKELLSNAMEFSENETSIIVIFRISVGELSISIINKPISLAGGIIGIPPEYERMVFEPFFRLVKTVDERYETLDFGLGLTFVDKVIRNFHGVISVANIVYHDILIDLDKAKAKDERVNFTVELPIIS